MNRILRCFVLAAFLAGFLLPQAASAQNYVYHKVQIGTPFVHFDLEDIFHQRWVSTYLRGKPVIILTGHRYQRYEILKWAETFRAEYGLPGHVHLLWAVNLRKYPWSTSRATVIRQWRDFNSPIPVLMDWEGVIGKGLRINYNVPNIIILDAFGRLALHQMHSYNPEVYAAISARVRSLLEVNPGYAGVVPGMAAPGLAPMTQPVPVGPMNPGGRKGDSY